MTKYEFTKTINQRIDSLILDGLYKPENKKEFKHLCKMHRTYVIKHLSNEVKGKKLQPMVA